MQRNTERWTLTYSQSSLLHFFACLCTVLWKQILTFVEQEWELGHCVHLENENRVLAFVRHYDVIPVFLPYAFVMPWTACAHTSGYLAVCEPLQTRPRGRLVICLWLIDNIYMVCTLWRCFICRLFVADCMPTFAWVHARACMQGFPLAMSWA
jgi:hypothetical protein